MATTTEHDILVERDDGIVVVTLNRPQVRNALTLEMYDDLERIFIENASARCIVLTGAGKGFCAGDDIYAMFEEKREFMAADWAANPQLTPASRAILAADAPIVAAVNGPAVGWGMDLALHADIRIASESARFSELFVRRGVCGDTVGLIRLPKLIGPERAAELLFTGRFVDAHEAYELGIVSSVVGDADLMPSAMSLARQIAGNPPLSVRATKQGLRLAEETGDYERVGQFSARRFAELILSEDHRESVSAYIEKRAPHFIGR